MVDFFNDKNTKFDVYVNDWKDAIYQCVEILEKNKLADLTYKEHIIDDFYKYGSYIMISPGIVIPHTRPENGAIARGFSLISVKNDVFFPDNNKNPIKILIGFTTIDNLEHLEMLKILVDVIENCFVNKIDEFNSLASEQKLNYLNKFLKTRENNE